MGRVQGFKDGWMDGWVGWDVKGMEPKKGESEI